MRGPRWTSRLAFCLVLLGRPAHAAGTLDVPLAVTERAGVARTGEVVASGLPLPRGAQITSTAGLSLLEAGTGAVVDADFQVTARWGGAPGDATRPIKWLLVTFRCSVAAGATARYVLTDVRPAAAGGGLILDQRDTAFWAVETGAARFEVSTGGPDLFRRVVVDGAELVSPSPRNGPYDTLAGARHQASAARGGGSLALHSRGDRNRTLTLLARGSHRTFDDRADEDLDVTTYLTFTHGSAAVLVRHVVQNNRPWTPLENNASFRVLRESVPDPWNGNQETPTNLVLADEIGLALALSPGASPSYTVGVAPGEAALTGSLSSRLTVYQDNSGDAGWTLWRDRHATGDGEVASPLHGPAAYVRADLRGFRVTHGAATLRAGHKMSGYLDVNGPNGGLTVSVRGFWQSFPKALRATPGGEVEVALFPEEFRARHALRVGEQKTHEILFRFHGPSVSADEVAGAGLGFETPLSAQAPPSWYAEITRAVPAVSTAAGAAHRFPTIAGVPERAIADIAPADHDRYLVKHLEGPAATSSFFAGLDEAIPAAQLYSWMDHGDLPIDFEQGDPCTDPAYRSVTGQYGWKYDGDHGLLLSYLRSGDPRFLQRGLAAVMHTADIDTLHHGRQSGRGIADFRDGGMFGHSQHLDDGVANPHRNGDSGNPCASQGYATGNFNGTPTADMIYGAQGMALAYFLTGAPQLAESLLDLAEWTEYMVPSWGLGSGRAAANALNTFTAALEVTGDARYRLAAGAMLATSSLLAAPMGPSWLSDARMVAAVGRHVSLLREAGDRSQDGVLALLASGEQSLLKYTGDACRADAYAWGALLLPDKRDLRAKADAAFASAARYPAFCGEGGCYHGIAGVWQVKEWVVSLACGHAYQLATYELSGGPRFAPSSPALSPAGAAAVQNAPPLALISGPPSIGTATRTPVSFDGSTSSDADSPALTYLWDFGDGTTATGATATHTYETAGTYTATLYAGDGEAAGRAQQTVEVAFTNTAPVARAGPDRKAPAGVALTFDGGASSDADGQPLTYAWDFGDGTTATGAAPSHAYTRAGTFTVTLAVGDGSATASDTLTVAVSTVSVMASQTTLGASRDTLIWGGPGATYNYGARGYVETYVDNPAPLLHSLVGFDLAAIPEGSLIESAALELTSRPATAPPRPGAPGSRRPRCASTAPPATGSRAAGTRRPASPGPPGRRPTAPCAGRTRAAAGTTWRRPTRPSASPASTPPASPHPPCGSRWT